MRKIWIRNAVLLTLLFLLFFTKPGIAFRARVMRVFISAPSIKKEEEYSEYKLIPGLKRWVVKDLQGNHYRFSDLGKKPIFISFWTTWSPASLSALHSIQKLYDKYHDRVVFVMISNEKPAAIKSYLADHPYTFPVYTPLTATPRDFKMTSIPFTVVMDIKQKSVLREAKASDWDTEVVHKLLEHLIKND